MKNYLIIGDVHADFDVFSNAVQFATDNDMHLVSVGDLIDNGTDGAKVIDVMLSLVKEGKATFVKGNHEHKIIRWCNGHDVTIGPPNQVTIDQFNMPGGDVFKSNFIDLVENHGHDYLRIENKNYIAHAGMHKDFWQADLTNNKITKDMINAMYFGQADHKTTYEWKGQTYPKRIYNWVDFVPAGVRLIVGHDPAPLNEEPKFDSFQHEPKVFKNDNGGEIIFLDCGAGKGGKLFGVVLNSSTNETETFVEF